MMKWILVGLILLVSLNGMFAHEVVTGDPVHDQNEEHQAIEPPIDSPGTAQYTAQKEVSSWRDAWPYVLLLFLGLGGFAFAMGMVLHPTGNGKRRR